ncbi:glycosyltransferase [Micromonospora sp. NPDC050417]|uniref:glycosyltransferase n=1 Tax=Micromonospora sp. NPDC050417 TaxID=3364280 RepID=UPI00378AB856
MRILFSAVALFGHVLPMVPLARAARGAGHEVALVTGPEMVGKVDSELPILSAGPTLPAMVDEAERRSGLRLGVHGVPGQIEFFAAARVDLTIDEAVAAAREWKPDLVVCETSDNVGPLLATQLGVPWSRIAYGPRMEPETVRLVAEKVAPRYEARGLTQRPAVAYLDPCPLSLQPAGWEPPAPRLTVRPEPHRQAGFSWSVPEFPGRTGLPLVLVTLGTIFNSDERLGTILESLKSIDVNVIATIDDKIDRDALAIDTEQVRLVDFVPLDQLLDGVDAVVTVGGAGTMLATLSRGIPLVMLPQGADHPRNVAAATATGAAIGLERADEVGPATAQLLAEGSYRAAAAKVAEEMATMNSTPEALRQLVALAAAA